MRVSTMRTANLVLILTSVISITCTHAKIGYFWHITDFHYDPLYAPQGDTRRQCRRGDERGSSGHHRALGRFGDYVCDSPLELIESAARHMRSRHAENVEFVLWTGDIISSQYRGDKYQAIRNMTDLLSRTFSSHFVFPVLGHLDPRPSENLTNLWMHWLPLEALQTFTNGGYYTIEQSHSKLRIVALNTNLFGPHVRSSEYVKKQWDWLEGVLDKAATNKEMVYMVGHTAPGTDPRRSRDSSEYLPDANELYLRLVRRYSRVIAGQFFGHSHTDTFRVFYDNDRPVSWALLAPSVSPYRDSSTSSNPGLRLYKFDTNSGKVLDYTQYYLDLAASNRAGSADWVPEYNLTQHYGLQEVSSLALHQLAEKLRPHSSPHELTVFQKYLRAYSVRHEGLESCTDSCSLQHFCAITCLDHLSYSQCVQAAASALAAADKTASLVAPLVTKLIPLLALLTLYA